MEAIYTIDFAVLHWIMDNLWCPFLDWLMPLITLLGEDGIFWIAVAVLLLIFPKTRKTGAMMGVAMALGLLVGNLTMKPAFARIRPYENEAGRTVELLVEKLSDYSFPSGHTLVCFGGDHRAHASPAQALGDYRPGERFPSRLLAAVSIRALSQRCSRRYASRNPLRLMRCLDGQWRRRRLAESKSALMKNGERAFEKGSLLLQAPVFRGTVGRHRGGRGLFFICSRSASSASDSPPMRVDDAGFHRFAAVNNRSHIGGNFVGLHHHFAQVIGVGLGMVSDKAQNAFLHMLEVAEGLGDADHEAGSSAPDEWSWSPWYDKGYLCRHRERHPDRVSTTQHHDAVGLSCWRSFRRLQPRPRRHRPWCSELPADRQSRRSPQLLPTAG